MGWHVPEDVKERSRFPLRQAFSRRRLCPKKAGITAPVSLMSQSQWWPHREMLLLSPGSERSQVLVGRDMLGGSEPGRQLSCVPAQVGRVRWGGGSKKNNKSLR